MFVMPLNEAAAEVPVTFAGIKFLAAGQEVVAPTDGTAKIARFPFGYAVIVETPRWRFRIFGLTKVTVKNYQKVKAGEVLGVAGPKVHYDIILHKGDPWFTKPTPDVAVHPAVFHQEVEKHALQSVS